MRQTGLTLYKPNKAYPGYTLLSPMEGTATYLLDMHGNIVHRWQLEYRPGDYGYLLENGNLLVSGRTEKGPVTFEGEMVWEYTNPFYGNDERFGHVNRVFRAYRYGPDFPGFRGKNLDPGRYDWLNRLYQ